MTIIIIVILLLLLLTLWVLLTDEINALKNKLNVSKTLMEWFKYDNELGIEIIDKNKNKIIWMERKYQDLVSSMESSLEEIEELRTDLTNARSNGSYHKIKSAKRLEEIKILEDVNKILAIEYKELKDGIQGWELSGTISKEEKGISDTTEE